MHEPLRLLYELAATHDGVVCLNDARAVGLSDRQIDRHVTGRWSALYETVYLAPGAPLTWRGKVRAGCLAGAPHAAASHRTAAAFYDVVGGNRSLVELTCERWFRTQHAGLVVHERTRVLPEDTQLIDDIPITRPELVVLQLAGIYRSPDFIERVLQSMRRNRLITLESTDEMLRKHARKGVRGVKVTRAALARWKPDQRATESDAEVRLLQILRDEGFPSVEPQVEIFDAEGRFVARVDFALRDLKIGIEYDGRKWHDDEISHDRDNRRKLQAAAVGWYIFTARSHDLRTGGTELRRALRTHILALRSTKCGGPVTQEGL